jgi:myo-inositol-1(or 4)-monophosphatase
VRWRSPSPRAEEAGALLLAHFGRLDPAEIGTKTSARDLVTVADLASERAIVARAARGLPGACHRGRGGSSRRARGRAAALVPRSARRHGQLRAPMPAFAVSLALYWRGTPQVAVVHVPLLRETFRASLGGGAFLGPTR